MDAPHVSQRFVIPSPWDGRLIAALGVVFLAAYVFVFITLVNDPPTGFAIGAAVISSIQVLICVVIAGFLVSRPRNRPYAWVALALGTVITALSVVLAVSGAASGLHNVLRSPLFFLAVIAFALFDTGRVQSWIDRRITLPVSALAVALFVALVLVTPRLPSGAVGLDCTGGECPLTGLNIADSPGAATWLANAYLIARTVAMAAAAVALVQRFRASGGTFRAQMRPVAAIGVLFMTAGVLGGIIDLANLGETAQSAISPLTFITRIAVPVAIGAGVLIGEQRRGGTLERDFAAIRSASTPTEVEVQLRSLLSDRSLRVVLPSQELPACPEEFTELRGQDGRLVATICHRAGLEADQPVAFSIAMPAATLALKQMELEQQVTGMRDLLSDAKQQAVMAGDEERKRIEQDLHDGAQLRVIMLRGRIEQLASRTSADATSQGDIDTMLREADELLAEIRGMTAGMRRVRPGHLREALIDLAAAAPLSARVSAGDLGELSADVEQAVFYCISEAVQNAAKHAGPRAAVAIEVTREGDDLLFTVADDGAGMPPDVVPGHGISGMADRMTALGGSFSPPSPLPFGGVTLGGRVPAMAMARRPETA